MKTQVWSRRITAGILLGTVELVSVSRGMLLLCLLPCIPKILNCALLFAFHHYFCVDAAFLARSCLKRLCSIGLQFIYFKCFQYFVPRVKKMVVDGILETALSIMQSNSTKKNTYFFWSLSE